MEARALRRRDSESSATTASDDGNNSPTETSLTHVHARCIPFATRVRYPDYYGLSSPFSDCDSDSDSEPPSPPLEVERGRSPFVSRPAIYEAPSSTMEKGGITASTAAERPGSGTRKSVNFASGERPHVIDRKSVV